MSAPSRAMVSLSATAPPRAPRQEPSAPLRARQAGGRGFDLLVDLLELGLRGPRSLPSGVDPRLASPSSLSLRIRVMRIRRSFILDSPSVSRASRSR
jgi:hypothetical protein